MAANHEAEIVPWEDRLQTAAGVDLLVTCTGAAAPVFSREELGGLAGAREGRGLLVIDMAVPPDVAPVAEGEPDPLSGGRVTVIDLEDIGAYQKSVEQRRCEAAATGERIVEKEAVAFEKWLADQRLGPLMERLREAAGRSLDKELRRRVTDADDPEYSRLDEFGRTLIKRFLGDYRRIADED